MKRIISLLTAILALFICNSYAQTPKKLRLGVAGLTHGHVVWILDRSDDGDLDVVGIAEPDKALAEKYFAKYKIPMSLWYPSVAEMLDKAKPEAVTTFTSTYDHLEVIKECAKRKVHVMVEKPLAVSVDHAKQIQALAKANNIHVITNYETTWYGSNRAIEEVKAKNQIGPLRKVVVHDGHEGPKEINVPKEFFDWLTDPVKNGGGAIMDFGCYGANLITWLMDGRRPTSVTAVTQTIKPDIYPKVDDEATIIVTYPQMQGIIQASWNWPFGRKDMEIYGKTGSIMADRNESRLRTGAKEPVIVTPSVKLERPYNDPFAYLAGVVHGEVRLSPTDLSSLENNVIVVEILEAAKQSAKDGKAVFLK
ncbi:MAG TPA: Gfo/Idh/MocA family oxidoreductase [Cyclobacteriaceae bacterium]|nr:Gfo/Idh/MocA family oxidoreductase [Cyclobacteriaceae bacterium]